MFDLIDKISQKMPIHRGKDSEGSFWQWGQHGAKYHWKKGSVKSCWQAYKKAQAQAKAAHANGWRN